MTREQAEDIAMLFSISVREYEFLSALRDAKTTREYLDLMQAYCYLNERYFVPHLKKLEKKHGQAKN